jgi:serine protease Do
VSLKQVFTFVFALLACTYSVLPSADIISTIERVKPSIVVVGIYNKASSPQFQMRGTGFVIASGNLVATNAHVIPEINDPESRIAVLQIAEPRSSSQVRMATILARDPQHDLAILRFDGAQLPAVQFSDSDSAREGQSVAFTGFPIGGALGFSPVTHRGMIASITPIALPGNSSRQINEKLIRQLKRGTFNIFQLDATAYPGNSGSPIFDTETGEVVGILNMVFIKGVKEAALSHPSGISYAIPSNHLTELLQTVSAKH